MIERDPSIKTQFFVAISTVKLSMLSCNQVVKRIPGVKASEWSPMLEWGLPVMPMTLSHPRSCMYMSLHPYSVNNHN